MQTRIIPMPLDFKVPFKEGFKFELNGMVMEVYEIKRPKPNPRFLVKAVGLIVPDPQEVPTAGELIQVTEDGEVVNGQSPVN